MSRTQGLMVLMLVLAALRAGSPPATLRAAGARAAAVVNESLPDPLPDAAILEAPRVLPTMLDGLRSGATPWLLAAQAVRAEVESAPSEARAALEGLLGTLPWDSPGERSYGLSPDASPGLHPIQVGGVRGTLAVTDLPDGRRSFALGARGGAWKLVVSARGRLAPSVGGSAPVGAGPGLIAAGALAPATLELTADVAWTRPGNGSERSRTWNAAITSAAGDPLRAADGGRAGGTLRIGVTAPDGRTGQLALELAPGGLRARGRWPAANLDEDLSTSAGRIVVQGRAVHGLPATRVDLPADGGPVSLRAVMAGPSGRIACLVDARLDSAGPVGTWQDLAAEPPAAGIFHVVAGAVLVVGDHLGRTVSTSLTGNDKTARIPAGRSDSTARI